MFSGGIEVEHWFKMEYLLVTYLRHFNAWPSPRDYIIT